MSSFRPASLCIAVRVTSPALRPCKLCYNLYPESERSRRYRCHYPAKTDQVILMWFEVSSLYQGALRINWQSGSTIKKSFSCPELSFFFILVNIVSRNIHMHVAATWKSLKLPSRHFLMEHGICRSKPGRGPSICMQVGVIPNLLIDIQWCMHHVALEKNSLCRRLSWNVSPSLAICRTAQGYVLEDPEFEFPFKGDGSPRQGHGCRRWIHYWHHRC